MEHKRGKNTVILPFELFMIDLSEPHFRLQNGGNGFISFGKKEKKKSGI